MRHSKAVAALLAAIGTALAVAVSHASGLPPLSIFRDAPTDKGLWRMEFLESSDKNLARSGAMGPPPICMDVAKELGKGVTDEENCATRVLRDTTGAAQLEMHCPNGDRISMTVTRESRTTFLIDSRMQPKSGAPMTMKARYHHLGACKSDSLIQFDRASPQCQKIRSQMANMDPARMCASTPPAQRAACEAQARAQVASIAKMCP